MRMSDWSSDVCSSDLPGTWPLLRGARFAPRHSDDRQYAPPPPGGASGACGFGRRNRASPAVTGGGVAGGKCCNAAGRPGNDTVPGGGVWIHCGDDVDHRSEEHTSELQSLMRISYAVFCLKKKT